MTRAGRVITLVIGMATASTAGATALQDPVLPGLDAPALPVLRGAPPPAPVLLVPGWSHEVDDLAPLRERLLAAGWPEGWVRPLYFEDPVGSNRDHARAVAQAARDLLAETGAERIDVIAHSMGGLSTRYYLQNGGQQTVRRVVFLATPHEGTISAFFGWGEGAREMRPGSAFLLGLRTLPAVPRGVRALSIHTPLDLHVIPRESATLVGAPAREVCCPTHEGLLDDDETFRVVERFLRSSGD